MTLAPRAAAAALLYALGVGLFALSTAATPAHEEAVLPFIFLGLLHLATGALARRWYVVVLPLLQVALVPVIVRGHASLLAFLILAVPVGAALVAIGVGVEKARVRVGGLGARPRLVVGRVLAGLAFLTWATVVGFVALLLGAMRCDEACSADGGWTTDAHAFQWGVIGVLGPVVFALAVAAVVSRLAGRPQAALILFGLQAAAMASLALTGTIGGSPGGSIETLVLVTVAAQALGFLAIRARER